MSTTKLNPDNEEAKQKEKEKNMEEANTNEEPKKMEDPLRRKVGKKKKEERTPFSLIKQQNKLYFSYELRGCPKEPLPKDFCQYCR